MPHSANGYNELLYAHLLDNEGARLTYTHFTSKVGIERILHMFLHIYVSTYIHFTSKVNWNSMIEISFNRSVLIQASKVYRIGMVLNKVGYLFF